MSREKIKLLSLTRAREGGWLLEGHADDRAIQPVMLFAGSRKEMLDFLVEVMAVRDGEPHMLPFPTTEDAAPKVEIV
ncbi:hypothetical protein [Celeribacter sp.]|uniref:hypothetical protein n=1 Tax=Celeribacter sp. TaxID=1890673 RepID=UPI003A8FD128